MDQALEKSLFWRGHDQAQRRSGLTILEYCKREGLNHHNFSKRRQRHRDRGASLVTRPTFVKVVESKLAESRAPLCRIPLSQGLSLECMEWPEVQWLQKLGGRS